MMSASPLPMSSSSLAPHASCVIQQELSEGFLSCANDALCVVICEVHCSGPMRVVISRPSSYLDAYNTTTFLPNFSFGMYSVSNGGAAERYTLELFRPIKVIEKVCINQEEIK